MKYPSVFRAPFQIRWSTVGAIVTLAGAAGLVAGSAWLSVQFIVDPRSVIWLNQFLPVEARIPVVGGDEPRTLAEVQTALKKAGLTTGDPLLLEGTAKKNTDLLLPILKRQDNCDLDCDRIIELRVYRPIPSANGRSKKQYVQMISQLGIDESDESFVVAPIVKARPGGYQAADRSLPFTTLQRLEDRAPNGTWLNLAGQIETGDTPVAYGQIVHFNPTRTRLNALLRWTSPAGETPTWKKPAKGNPPELWINQTVGLEPDFQAYQLRARKSANNPLQLTPISLAVPALDNGAYIDALYLARSGLWSTALEILQSVKKRSALSEWTPAAQTQMNLVAKHAQVTRSQAEKPWVSIGQQALVNLIDGRWARAQQLLQTSATDQNEIATLLKTDSGRLWKRVSAALKINPYRQDVQTWGALILASQQGRSPAIAWLKKQPIESSVARAQTLKLINQLDSSQLDPDAELTAPLLPQKPTQKSPQPPEPTVRTLP
ncbi:MAG: hypothetical protein HC780_15895 [Leptolyngbyaceae cyanobacterium CSU_1_3]|nr:hypothetical protein [Leptolyngbyaceae cyanobacterium CSU_1_3]